jgi:hypothetical protein
MGSQGIKRRKVRRRPPADDAGAALRSDWELENAPFTFEGEIEGLSRFGRGLSTAPPWMRVTAKIVAVTFLLPFVIFVVAWLLD